MHPYLHTYIRASHDVLLNHNTWYSYHENLVWYCALTMRCSLKRRVLWTTYIDLFSLTLKVNRADVNAVQYRPHTALFVRRPLHSYLSTDSQDGNFGKHDCTALTPSILYLYTSSWRMLFVVWLCLTHKVFYDVSDKHVNGSARTARRCRSRLHIQYHQASASNIKSYNRS
jgi:hypothetical protein